MDSKPCRQRLSPASTYEVFIRHQLLARRLTADYGSYALKLSIRDADWRSAQEAHWWEGFPINLALPSYYRSQGAAECLLGHRDGVVAGIALELYRQERGGYPESLNALVPRYLSEVPVDHITGAPMSLGYARSSCSAKTPEGRYVPTF